eukprot:TRINITY_DN1474_c0_g2_i4.p1 TRINITY_DN1474_c0_g2~~TRINITY_DN1474_c0_g2_i4.p1  ORF type:complete len:463 (-),score=158.61 TRINITY_DN1474_c0_g2_i4:150-1538(-)
MEFNHIEAGAMNAKRFQYRRNGNLDLESIDGYCFCGEFLLHIEQLAKLLNVKPANREYRGQFSQPYKMLYANHSDFCYLTEILDLAQECFPYIVVNGEKYIFSSNVLRYGEQLAETFRVLKDRVIELYEIAYDDCDNIMEKVEKLREQIKEFDRRWARFEKIYVLELILIDKDARRFVLQAIELDSKMRACEISESLKGSVSVNTAVYDLLRRKFVALCGKINAVANSVGKGRDDLSLEILLAAEETCRTITDNKSRAMRKLAGKIKETFASLRQVFRKYSHCIELIDPELSNNQDLLTALVNFEKAWERGKNFLINARANKVLLEFSEHVEGLAEKYEAIKEKMESMDAEIFITIPSLAILRSLDDNNNDMYSIYYPEVQSNPKEAKAFNELKKMYKEMRRKGERHKVYNEVERAILENETRKAKREMKKLLHEIKRLAILLQRNKPSDWNTLMEIAMGIV